MLKFLKKIFIIEKDKPIQPKPKIEINIQNIEDWIEQKSKPQMEDAKQKINQILMKINEEVQRTSFSVEVLEHSKLQNPDIPYKAKQYMEGNRKTYARYIISFLGHMEINNTDFYYLKEFCDKFNELISDLNKSTMRAYTILQEFFANETSKIANNLKNIDNLVIELRAILNSEQIVNANISKEKVQSLKLKLKQKLNLEVDIKNSEAEIKITSSEKDAIMKEIKEFNNSEEHNKFLKLKEFKKNKVNSIGNDARDILKSFAILEKPLRKYSHTAFEHEEAALSYIKDPIEALSNDKEFEILNILRNLEKMIEQNNLQLEEKKKLKSLEELKNMNKEFLEQFLKKYSTHKEEMDKINEELKKSKVAEKFKEYSKKLQDINRRIDNTSENTEKLKNDSEKLKVNGEELRFEIENSIKNVFNEEVKIVG